MAKVRHEYLLSLPMSPSVVTLPPLIGIGIREPEVSDSEALAHLMQDSYVGTIDYDGESIKEALAEIGSYFTRTDAPPMTSVSTMAMRGEDVISACLISYWEKRNEPLVGYVMTLAELKGRGLGTYVTAESMRKLSAVGHRGVRAVITEGNTPSERLFGSLGFVRAPPSDQLQDSAGQSRTY